MARRLTVVVVLACAVAAAAAAHRQTPPASTRQLEIDAVALDRENRPVADLKPGDLEVWIGGFRVPVQSLTAVPPSAPEHPGRLIVVLLDDITMDPTIIPRAREAAMRLVDQARPEDRMAIVRLNGGPVELTPLTARLRQQIDDFRQSLGMLPVDQLGVQLLARVTGIARMIAEAPERRKLIVAIGSAWLLDTPVPPAEIGGGRSIREEWFEAMRALGVSNVSYYVIDPGGVGSSRQMGGGGFAREAGGHAFLHTNDLKGAADRILREADNYYVIRVGDPPVGRTAVVRELDVKSLRRGVTIRTRRSIPGGAAR